MRTRKGIVFPALALGVFVIMGTTALFGRSVLDTMAHGFCKLPCFEDWSMCTPTIFDWIGQMMPYVFFVFIGLGFYFLASSGSIFWKLGGASTGKTRK